MATFAIVTGRWVSDRAKDTIYGELLRVIDNEEQRVQRPAFIVAGVGIATSLLGILLILTVGEVSRTVTVWAYSVLLFLAVYSILGLVDLLRLSRRHLARLSRLQAMIEEENRRRRESQAKQEGQVPPKPED